MKLVAVTVQEQTGHPPDGPPSPAMPGTEPEMPVPGTGDSGGRKNHRWGFIEDPHAAETEVACRNCGLVERTGYYLNAQGTSVAVLQWITPAGALLRIRPVIDLHPQIRATQTVAEAFTGVEIGGSPQCPKSPEAWSTRPSEGPS